MGGREREQIRTQDLNRQPHLNRATSAQLLPPLTTSPSSLTPCATTHLFCVCVLYVMWGALCAFLSSLWSIFTSISCSRFKVHRCAFHFTHRVEVKVKFNSTYVPRGPKAPRVRCRRGSRRWGGKGMSRLRLSQPRIQTTHRHHTRCSRSPVDSCHRECSHSAVHFLPLVISDHIQKFKTDLN